MPYEKRNFAVSMDKATKLHNSTIPFRAFQAKSLVWLFFVASYKIMMYAPWMPMAIDIKTENRDIVRVCRKKLPMHISAQLTPNPKGR